MDTKTVFPRWSDLSECALHVMRDLGNFGPTVNPENREVKGYMLDPDGDCGKCYYNSNDLRLVAQGCIEVANWLDKRAELLKETE